jgi:hypothetical protein
LRGDEKLEGVAMRMALLLAVLLVPSLKIGVLAANRPQGSPQPSAPAQGATDPALVGHWRTTRIVFESPRDDHLVLRVDGTAERWSVTASSAGPKTVGQWAVTGSVLSLTWTGGAQTSQAFTMYQSQLVLPNVPNRRVFWDRLDR